MEKKLVTQWFLGANTACGFYSIYEDFAAGEHDFLRVIKGGPGGGKSGFMKKIGAAAQDAGYDVEYILCSGDPDSLDGVYIPALGIGYADGTSPHIMDPKFFGATGDYLNLGEFCDTDAAMSLRPELEAVTREYRGLYTRAYSYLAAAQNAATARGGAYLLPEDVEASKHRAISTGERELPRTKHATVPGRVTRRLVSACSCKGRVLLHETMSRLCERIYVLDDRMGLADTFLRQLLDMAVRRGVDVIACPRSSNPDMLEALLIPSLSLGYFADGHEFDLTFKPYRRLRLDGLVDSERMRALKPRLRADAKLANELTESAIGALAEAKALHDKLEELYHPHINFTALTAATKKELKLLKLAKK